MKKIIICMLTVLLAFAGSTLALAASNDDGGFSAGAEAAESTRTGAAYSVVSAVVNREYDFKEDFHDSYPYDEDFCTEGIFNLDDYNGDVTLTLENNSTSERFVFERNAGCLRWHNGVKEITRPKSRFFAAGCSAIVQSTDRADTPATKPSNISLGRER